MRQKKRVLSLMKPILESSKIKEAPTPNDRNKFIKIQNINSQFFQQHMNSIRFDEQVQSIISLRLTQMISI